MSKHPKSLRDRLFRQWSRGDDNIFVKIHWKLRAKLRACTHKPRPTWVGPTPTLMGLPVDIRLIIHEFALQDVIEDAFAHTKSTKPPTLFYGGLALCHVNRTLHAECQDIFIPLVMKTFQLHTDHNYTLILTFFQGTQEERAATLWAWASGTKDSDSLEQVALKLATTQGGELFKKWETLQDKRRDVLLKILRMTEGSTTV